MKKKIMVLVTAMFVLFGTILGTGSTQTAKAQDVTELTLALWNKEQEPVLRSILDQFEEQNPDISVELQLTPNPQYWTKLEAAATGGAMADIVWMNGPNFINYASNGIIAPIDDYLAESEIDLANYPEGLVQLYTHEEQVYGVPKDWDTTALWYNKEMFDAAGVEYPTNDWTFDEMVEAARTIQESQGVYGVVANYMTQEGLYDIIPQNGGYIINEERTQSGYNTPEAIEAAQKWIGLIEEGISPELATQTETGPRDLFAAEQVAMVYAASWNVPVFVGNENLAGKVDLVEMPTIKEKAATIHGLIYALNANSENQDQAFRVIEYLASEEANQIWAESGVVIPAHQGVLDTWVEANPEYNLDAYVKSLDYAIPFPISKNSAVWNQMESDTIRNTYTGEMDIAEGFTKLGEDMNQALSNEQ